MDVKGEWVAELLIARLHFLWRPDGRVPGIEVTVQVYPAGETISYANLAKLQELRDESLMARLNYKGKAAYEKMIDPRACVLYNGKPVKAKCPTRGSTDHGVGSRTRHNSKWT